MTDFPAAGYFSDPARTNSQAKSAQDSWLARCKELLGGAAESTLTIATGSVTPTGAVHLVDTEALGATDDLDLIAQTNTPDGSILIISSANNARVPTIRHGQTGTGQILLADSANFALANTTMFLKLKRVGTTWVEIGRSWGSSKSSFRSWLGVAIGVDVLAYSANVVYLNVIQAWTKPQRMAHQALSSSAGTLTIDWNTISGNNVYVALTENITTITCSNFSDGSTVVITFKQDATARTITGWPTIAWHTSDGSQPTISTTSGKTMDVTLKYNSTLAKYIGKVSQEP